MSDLITRVIQYAVYAAELFLFVKMLRKGHWKRWAGVFVFVFSLFALDAIARPYVGHHYGTQSMVFYNFFWLTDVLLALLAFVLICLFFGRACAHEEKLWSQLRLMLVVVFLLVLGISFFSLSRNVEHWYGVFMLEFTRNLYFTCLVLNTMLYILMQRFEHRDEQLAMLVCGMGIQFAAPAASLALIKLLPAWKYLDVLFNHLDQLCTLAMLLVWLYAVTKLPTTAKAAVPAMAEAH